MVLKKKYQNIIWGNKKRTVGCSFKQHLKNGGEQARYAGVDIATPRGTTIKAESNGRVTHVRFYPSDPSRNFIRIDHGDHLIDYVHLPRLLLNAKEWEGRKIKRGRPIGRTGKNWIHLSYLVKKGKRGVRVDPMPRLFPKKKKAKEKPKPTPKKAKTMVQVLTSFLRSKGLAGVLRALGEAIRRA